MEPKYNPAAVIGFLTSLAVAVLQIVDTAGLGNGEFSWQKVLVAVLPFLAGLGIRQQVLSKAWLYDVIVAADTVLDALRPVVTEVDVPPELRPTQP